MDRLQCKGYMGVQQLAKKANQGNEKAGRPDLQGSWPADAQQHSGS